MKLEDWIERKLLSISNSRLREEIRSEIIKMDLAEEYKKQLKRRNKRIKSKPYHIS
jgi:hypothetical protein